MLLSAASASAGNINFNGGSVSNCTLSGNTYSCSSLLSAYDDIAVIASGYTVVLSGGFSPGWNQGLSMSGSAVLQTTGNNPIDLTGSNNINVNGGTLRAGGNFNLGSNSQSITANVIAATVTTGGASSSITGNVTASGAISLGSQCTITGAVSAASISTNSNVRMGSLTTTGNINLGSQNTITGAVNGASITTNSNVTMGSLTVSGAANLASQNVVNGLITVDTLVTNSGVTLTGNINAATSVTLGSGSNVTGNITAPNVTLNPAQSTVNGDIAAAILLDMGSNTTVNGNVTGGSLLMRPAQGEINGSVTMSGDVDMGSNANINGDLQARDVVTRSAHAIIDGNAAVNSIYIDHQNSVTKVITCTGPGAVGCSCVTVAGNFQPTCGAAPAAAPHHFQITHNGSALTCQPQTVTVAACADANCSSKLTSNVNVTLQPGNQSFAISGGVNAAATVQSSSAGTYTLSAAGTGVSNPTVCVNSSTGASGTASASGSPCAMNFTTSGLTVSASNHIAMAPGALVTLQALTAQAPNQSCVPLLANQTVNIAMACSYSNPSNAANVPVTVGGANLSCGSGAIGSTVSVPFSFNSAGLATASLQYAEVGQVGLQASYANANFAAAGSGSFIAAPARLNLTATNANVTPSRVIGPAALASAPTGVFAKAGESFTLTVTAVNYNGNATTNFGKEANPTKVLIPSSGGLSINNPLDAPVPSGTGTNGTLSYSFPSFSQGSSSGAASFSDVGYLKLTPILGLAGVTAGQGSSVYYLGQPLAIFQTTGVQYISRFVPDHFDTVLMTNAEALLLAPNTQAGLTMSCAGLVTGLNPCSGSSTSFINSKQFFFPKVLAYNGASPPALAANYAGALAQVITLSPQSASGGATAAAGAIAWSGDTATVTATRFAFNGGTGLLASPGPSGSNLPSFTFASAYPAADVPPATIYLRATDTDGVSSLRSAAASSVEAPLTVVSGRLLVANAYGSPTAPLPVAVTAQYYMPGGYVFNPLVSGSSNSTIGAKVLFSNCQNGLDTSSNSSHTCSATLKLVSPNTVLQITNGRGLFRIAAPTPTPTSKGSVDVQLQSLIPYLPSSTGRETFGIYRSGPVIYTREVFH